ncbi:extensin family protein [Aureimonas ureilytica]|uniref:extensin-like domain-containing protein n=1 Tax=Aureimonas ureilytica TaxID=401562 RepID=UPI003CEF843D
MIEIASGRRWSALVLSVVGRHGAALAVALGLGTAPGFAAPARPPVPAAAPEEAPRGEAAMPLAAPAPDSIPRPEPRPEPTPGDASDGPAGEAAPKPVGKPRTDDKPEAGQKPEPKAEDPAGAAEKPEAAPASAGTAPAPSSEPAGPAAPQPAYVPPDKARTTPEPSAPDVPDMAVTPAETVEAAAAVEDAVACEKELKARGVEFTVGETIADGQCGVLRPVSIRKLSSGVSVEPGTTFLCRTALALDIWVSEGVEPAAKAEFAGARVKALSQASTYVCRARASESRISEHSRGSAIDIAGFELSDGRKVPVDATRPGTPEDRFAARVRRAACGPFRTVLGPGTDSDHGTHLHLDIAARSRDATYCR